VITGRIDTGQLCLRECCARVDAVTPITAHAHELATDRPTKHGSQRACEIYDTSLSRVPRPLTTTDILIRIIVDLCVSLALLSATHR